MKCPAHGNQMFVVLDEAMGRMWVSRTCNCVVDEYWDRRKNEQRRASNDPTESGA